MGFWAFLFLFHSRTSWWRQWFSTTYLIKILNLTELSLEMLKDSLIIIQSLPALSLNMVHLSCLSSAVPWISVLLVLFTLPRFPPSSVSSGVSLSHFTNSFPMAFSFFLLLLSVLPISQISLLWPYSFSSFTLTPQQKAQNLPGNAEFSLLGVKTEY